MADLVFGFGSLVLVLSGSSWKTPRRALSSKAKGRRPKSVLMNLLARIPPYGIDGTHPRSEMPD